MVILFYKLIVYSTCLINGDINHLVLSNLIYNIKCSEVKKKKYHSTSNDGIYHIGICCYMFLLQVNFVKPRRYIPVLVN